MNDVRDMMERLAEHRALGAAPSAEHAWLAGHGAVRRLAGGEVIGPKGELVTVLWVLLSGRVGIRVDRGAGSHTLIEWRAGEVTGALPYSRGPRPPDDLVAEEPTEVLQIAGEDVPEMIRRCPVITAIMVHEMIDRSRRLTSADLHDEKLLSLGKLAAGLAHELNNPASAAARSVKMLGENLAAAELAARRLGTARLSERQLAAIDAMHERCVGSRGAPAPSAVERADREDAVTAWMVAHGADEESAVSLAERGVTPEELEALATLVQGDALHTALRWIAAGCQVHALTGEIEGAVSRIHDLVDAVKGFTFMDRAPSAGPVDLRRGIADTLTMLGAKMRGKSVEVALRIPADLPQAHAVGGELNQVWMNLIDNALDAVPAGGHVEVTAGRERDGVVVRIIDDGPGIAPAIQGLIFDPFFTTKGVGKGTGLGLDIVRRLLQRYGGGVDFDSRPGRTEFRVRLPAAI